MGIQASRVGGRFQFLQTTVIKTSVPSWLLAGGHPQILSHKPPRHGRLLHHPLNGIYFYLFLLAVVNRKINVV